jgi:hypothetical protein
MTTWAGTLLPIGTLVIGSLLTMGGQALRDRRAEKKEERVRREAFRVGNFEMHRSAMLEMQELVSDTFTGFLKEKHRREREGYYEYFDGRPFRKAEEFKEFLAVGLGLVILRQQMEDATEEERAEAVANRLAEAIDLHGDFATWVTEYKEMSEWIRDLTEATTAAMQSRSPYLEEFSGLVGKLRLCMYRSGSNSVVSGGTKLIEDIYSWERCIRTEGTDVFVDRARDSYRKLDRALSNALTFGPYDPLEKELP